jgi:hypothetical protein
MNKKTAPWWGTDDRGPTSLLADKRVGQATNRCNSCHHQIYNSLDTALKVPKHEIFDGVFFAYIRPN